jgi:hypothetical protein
MRKALLVALVFCLLVIESKGQQREFYQLKIYHVKTKSQEARVDQFLQFAWLPEAHKAGIKNIGVFKPVRQDTAEQLIYVLVPFKSLEQFNNLDNKLHYASAGKDYIDAAHNDVPYIRIESILLRAFPGKPRMEAPALTGPRRDRIYELRSYESPTEKYYVNKVKMFNEGGEISIFKRLNFNAIFYAEVLSGSRMPNLMYMTSFESIASRDEHWKAFSADEEWKKLRAMPEYQNNVSKADILLLYAVEYSDY